MSEILLAGTFHLFIPIIRLTCPFGCCGPNKMCALLPWLTKKSLSLGRCHIISNNPLPDGVPQKRPQTRDRRHTCSEHVFPKNQDNTGAIPAISSCPGLASIRLSLTSNRSRLAPGPPPAGSSRLLLPPPSSGVALR